MFKVSIYTYQEQLYFGLSQEVILPTMEGQIAIMDFHQPILSRLQKGTIGIDNKWFFKIKDGIACLRQGVLNAIVET